MAIKHLRVGDKVGKEYLHEIAQDDTVKMFAIVTLDENGTPKISWGGDVTYKDLIYASRALDAVCHGIAFHGA